MDNTTLHRLRTEIEAELGWGDAANWSTADFETLGDRIGERTGVQLSATTLKRVWGRVAYNSSPSPTTLDALATYLGYENWRAYHAAPKPPPTVVDQPAADGPAPPPPPLRAEPTPTSFPYRWLVAAVLGLGVIWWVSQRSRTAPASQITAPASAPIPPAAEELDPADYTFHHRPVTTGLPNSVVFTYDASAAPTDSVFIQQNWDERRRTAVSREGDVHTSLYYLPGYFRATLRVGDQEVRSREVLIPSEGWAVGIGVGREAPVYLPTAYKSSLGALAVAPDDVTALGLPLQPQPPVVWMSTVGDFDRVTTDDFRFSTRLRATYAEGAAACRSTRLLLLLRNSAIIIPLSSPGCIAELNLYAAGSYLDGASNDLSAFGVLEDDWVDLSIQGRGDLISIYLNDKLALQLESRDEPRDILGLRYEFSGGGAVDYARLEGNATVWEESFGVGK